jgi:glycosyltransferase involved in cell wall biosynthesis
VIVWSPSRSVGMSHYAQALAASLSRHTPVAVLDRAAGMGTFGTWRRLRRLLRGEARLLNTSPHWSVPLILAITRAQGGYVLHGPLVYLASRRTRRIYVAYYRFLTRRLSVVVLHAERFRSSLDALGLHPSRVVVVPHGFVPETLLDAGPYDPSGPFVCIGRMLPYKGVDVFVSALEILAADGRSVPAEIGGEGVTTEMVPKELPNVSVRVGPLSDDEFRHSIDSCSAVVLPYRKATQSGVLSTAFAAGRPVVATDVGSFPDYVNGANGVLVPADDPVALAEAMDVLRRDPARARRLATGARQSWEEHLNPDEAARQILDALEV